MALTFDSTKTAARPSHEALEDKEGDAVKPNINKMARDSAKKAGERMKQNEEKQGIFTK